MEDNKQGEVEQNAQDTKGEAVVTPAQEAPAAVEAAAPEAKKPEAELIPKYRYDEMRVKYEEAESIKERALDYIRAYTAQATAATKQEATAEERLARLEAATYNFYRQKQDEARAEVDADKALNAFEAEMSTRPHLKEFQKEIWEDITAQPNKAVADHVGKWDAVVKKSQAKGVSNSIAPKKAIAGHRTLSGVSGTPPSTIKARTDRLREKDGKVKNWEDFWDEANDLIKDGLREARVSRGEAVEE